MEGKGEEDRLESYVQEIIFLDSEYCLGEVCAGAYFFWCIESSKDVSEEGFLVGKESSQLLWDIDVDFSQDMKDLILDRSEAKALLESTEIMIDVFPNFDLKWEETKSSTECWTRLRFRWYTVPPGRFRIRRRGLLRIRSSKKVESNPKSYTGWPLPNRMAMPELMNSSSGDFSRSQGANFMSSDRETPESNSHDSWRYSIRFDLDVFLLILQY